ncbi:MAG: hypothetical protein ACO363_00800 [Balneolaceae bacterium]
MTNPLPSLRSTAEIRVRTGDAGSFVVGSSMELTGVAVVAEISEDAGVSEDTMVVGVAEEAKDTVEVRAV